MTRGCGPHDEQRHDGDETPAPTGASRPGPASGRPAAEGEVEAGAGADGERASIRPEAPFWPPVAVASLSGESDAAWAAAAAPHVGAAFLGGLAIDGPTRAAARELAARGREEFLPDDPVAFVTAQLDALARAPETVRPAVNVRTTSVDPLVRVAEVCADRGAAVEVNAHCRQAEMCAAGCGERLLRDGDRLARYVAAAAGAGATVSVKLRTEVDGVDLPALAERLAAAGADWLHVDAMDSEPVVAAVRRAAPEVWLVANNGVRGGATAREYRRYGADAVSVGRASDEPATLRRVRREAVTWTDAPSRRVRGAGGESA